MVLEHSTDANSILDLGCGEGQLLLMLRELTSIRKYYGYDLSPVFIDNLIRRWGRYPGLKAKAVNFLTVDKFPTTDLCTCMGSMLYIFDDGELKSVLANIKSKTFICRVPCSLGLDRVEIDRFSKDYGAKYAAVYRTIQDYVSILSESFTIKSIDRCYPDEIESKHNSKQFVFICERKV
jgi:SAM-dependent methyltransferase